jgi:hypothetical protein
MPSTRPQPKKKKLPKPDPAPVPSAVRYDARQALVACLELSNEAELAHRRLLDMFWATGRRQPARGKYAILAARARAGRWPAILEELLRCGWEIRAGQLTYPPAEATLQQALFWHDTQQRKGRLGGAARWRREEHPADAGYLCAGSDQDPPPKDSPGHSPGHTLGHGTGHTSGHSPVNVNREVNREPHLTDLPLTGERSPLTAQNAVRRKGGERTFLEDVARIMATHSPATAQEEMENFGGWWRNRFRDDAEKARRVLAEIAAMIRERRIASNPGAAAQDLWKRFS